jgi:hypothetical protein
MATKAEWFRYQTERSGPKRPKQPWVERVPHESARIGKNAAYALEDSAGRPSRKSTRKASNRARTDVQMRVKRQATEAQPGHGIALRLR